MGKLQCKAGGSLTMATLLAMPYQASFAIDNGERVRNVDERPYSSLALVNPGYDDCSGVVVAKNKVLISGGCARDPMEGKDLQPEDFSVQVQSGDFPNFYVSNVERSHIGDFAVLTLKTDEPTDLPVAKLITDLTRKDLLSQKSFLLVNGFGIVRPREYPKIDLDNREGYQILTSDHYATETWKAGVESFRERGVNFTHKFNPKNYFGTCSVQPADFGDEGAPAYAMKDGQYYLVGMVNWGMYRFPDWAPHPRPPAPEYYDNCINAEGKSLKGYEMTVMTDLTHNSPARLALDKLLEN